MGVLAWVGQRVRMGEYGREDGKDGLQHLKCKAKEFRFYLVAAVSLHRRMT